MTIRDIVIGAPLWLELRRHLLGNRHGGFIHAQDEQLAFVLASHNETLSGTRLVARELLSASTNDLAHQSTGGIGPTDQFVAQALTRCRTEGWSLIEVHSHPFDQSSSTTFSGIDWSNDRAKMPKVAALMPAEFHHATMVFGHSAFDVHSYDRLTSTIVPVPYITIVGRTEDRLAPFTRMTPTSSPPGQIPKPDARYTRQLPLLGADTQDLLSRTSVAVVGLGGLGSFVALELAHLGVGRIALIDPDRVEETNLNRLVGTTEADIDAMKVDVYARLLSSIAPRLTVTPVPAEIMDTEALEQAKSTDLILGCVDSHGGRLAMNHLAVRYLIPFLDAGSGVQVIDTESRYGGQIQLVAPGLGCLECRGFIDARRAAFDMETPEFQDYERQHGYGTDEPAPSVIFLNGVVASLQAGEAVRLLGGQETLAGGAILVYDGSTQRLVVAGHQLVDDCPTCGPNGVAGVADLDPLKRATRTATPPVRGSASSLLPAPNDQLRQGLLKVWRVFRVIRRRAGRGSSARQLHAQEPGSATSQPPEG